MRIVLQLFKIEWRNQWRSGLIPVTLLALTLLHLFSLGMNVENYRTSMHRLRLDSADGIFIRVPLEDPVKNYSYFSNYMAYSFPIDPEQRPPVGLLFLPDRWEDPGTATSCGRWYFLITAVIVLLFANRETKGIQRKEWLYNLLAGPVKRRRIFAATVFMGLTLAVIIFLLNTLITAVISLFAGLNLTLAEYEQIVLYHLCIAVHIAFWYGLFITLFLHLKEKNMALTPAVLFLLVIIYIVPAMAECFRSYVYERLPSMWRAEWYWYSRYLGGIDFFGSYSELISDILYPARAGSYFAGLSRTAHLVGSHELLSMGRLAVIQWYRWFTLGIWLCGVYIIAGRRFRKTDVDEIMQA